MSTHSIQHPLSRVAAVAAARADARPRRAPSAGSASPSAWPSWRCRGRMARVTGAPNLPTLTRACGLREIGTGIGILTSKDPSPWLWGRVAGDALDVATVGAGLVTAAPAAAHAHLARDAGGRRLDRHEGRRGGAAGEEAVAPALRDYSDAVGIPDARPRRCAASP